MHHQLQLFELNHHRISSKFQPSWSPKVDERDIRFKNELVVGGGYYTYLKQCCGGLRLTKAREGFLKRCIAEGGAMRSKKRIAGGLNVRRKKEIAGGPKAQRKKKIAGGQMSKEKKEKKEKRKIHWWNRGLKEKKKVLK
ncbi:hypothetical protein BTUL_0055g00660 [Botrytis tulipae]|uniref:Uncharacterized protein n=1 Tax=Botrytis tulipae TaxID=87230 RepID=A0A4Z1EPR2_9HELO|nr:hypothetical protein BTUL_0055g00660 [Botrytis tulipae]